MGFNKRFLPEIDEMQRIYDACESDIEFLEKVVGKSDAVMGSAESFEFLRIIEESVYGDEEPG